MSARFPTSVLCPVLVGRTPELAVIEHGLAAARGGTGQTIVLAGEAGIGKSRLVAEAKARALQQETLVLEGHCFEPDRVLPYAPLLDLLRLRLTGKPADAVVQELGPTAPELVKLLPELAPLLPDVSPRPSLEPEQEQRRRVRALAEYVVRLATTAPLLLVVEDLHWSDDPSLEVLLTLARRLATHPILLLLTYRSEDVHPGLAHFLAGLDRERLATELTLAPLSGAEVEALLRATLREQRPIRSAFLEALHALTEGNPFFMEEMLKSLVAAEDIFVDGGAWERRPLGELRIPRSVQDAVQQRAAQVSMAARELLRLAAVAGRRFDFVLLQALSQRDEPALLALIKELIAAQLVVEETAERFAFRHALTRQATYADLLARERRALHRRLADAIEQLYVDSLDLHLEDLAYHFYEAAAWEQALPYAQRAGARALALYAPQAAVEQFTRALEAAHHLIIPPSAAVHRARGQAYETLGEFEQARTDYKTALQVARASGNRQAEWQALLDLGLLWAGRDYAQAGDHYRQALQLARALGDPVSIAHSLNRLGNWYANSEQPDQALRHHHEALANFQAADDPLDRARTFDLLGMASFLSGDLHHCALYYEQAISVFGALDRRQELASTLATLAVCGPTYQLSVVVPAARAPAELVRAGEEALRIAREIGWRSGEAYALGTLAQCLGAQGAYARALELAQTAVAVAEEIAHRQWLAHAHWVAGMLSLDLLALPQARRHLGLAQELARAAGSWHWIRNVAAFLAAVVIAEGDLAGAEAVLDAALSPDAPALTLGQRLVWCARAELALAGSEADHALGIVDRLIASASAAAPGADGHGIARLMKLRGEALAALGRATEAEAALRVAQAVAHAQGSRPLLWRIHMALGTLYRRQRRREAASEFAAARAIIEELAVEIPDDPVRQSFLDRATAMMPRPHALSPLRADKQAFGGLTAREREVAALIARGATNRAIAELLCVSERTIGAHVSNILTKLNFTSRAQIAAWAIERGLARPK